MKIKIEALSIQLGEKRLLDNLNISIKDGEQWAVTGPSGSGKSMLGKAIAGRIFFRGKIEFLDQAYQHFSPKILLIEQQHQFKNKSNVSLFYYQQRFNSADSDDTTTVESLIEEIEPQRNDKWIDFFDLGPLLKKPLIQLSNGENKRLQLANAMIQSPELLILDNPFVGLDKNGRNSLQTALDMIVAQGTKILLIAPLDDLPKCITHVAVLHGGNLIASTTKAEALLSTTVVKKLASTPANMVYSPLQKDAAFNFVDAVNMQDVTISYNGKDILSRINWTVKKGERWCVTGGNGAGKSTLLSLVTADNPQAYANNIYLFDKKRGTGESIWDIKKNIGYVSPELHLFFDQGVTCFEAIASGLFDTIGLFRKPGPTETETINAWIENMGLSSIKEKRLNQLSLGEQRLVMLTRALVKSPPLLIFDEPCQGLDGQQTAGFKNMVDLICGSTSTTIIYVSHYSEDIPSCITHHLQLKGGKKLED